MSDASFTNHKSLTMTWKIKNFSFSWQGARSPPVSSRCFINRIFYLIVNHKRTRNNKHIMIIIGTINRNFSPLTYEVALVCSDGSSGECLKGEFEFEANSKAINYDNWIKETLSVPEKLIFEERRDFFLPDDTLTIRCRLQQHEFHYTVSEEHFVYSSIGVRRKLFIWALEEFSCDWTGKPAYLFTISGTYGDLCLKVAIEEEEIVVQVHRDKGVKIFSTLKISLLDAHGTERKLTNNDFFFEKSEEKQIWQSSPLININELIASKNHLLPNDTLSLKCEFAASHGLINETDIISCPKEFIPSSSVFHKPSFSNSIEKITLPSGYLQKDFKSILDTGSLSDLKLKVDSDVFPVHKAVLGARSPTFNAMFTNNFKEKYTGEVLISDIDTDTMRQFLLYLYTDIIDNLTIEDAKKLYFAADKYEVLCLREICASFLKANLSSSNVCEILILANLYQDEDLKSEVQHFICKHDSEILRSENWRDLEKSNQPLALETLREICLKKSTK